MNFEKNPGAMFKVKGQLPYWTKMSNGIFDSFFSKWEYINIKEPTLQIFKLNFILSFPLFNLLATD